MAVLTLALKLKGFGKKVVILESGGIQPEEITQSLGMGMNVGRNYYELDHSRTRAVGGSSHMWYVPMNSTGQEGVRLRRLDPIDFKKKGVGFS